MSIICLLRRQHTNVINYLAKSNLGENEKEQ